jgi:hypothetical protein
MVRATNVVGTTFDVLPHRRNLSVFLLVGIVLIGGGGSAATACKLWLNCHTHGTPSLANEIRLPGNRAASRSTAPTRCRHRCQGLHVPDFAFLDHSHPRR